MERKTLLVLAAAYYQMEVILRAKELGYRVVTTDNVPENPGHRLADRSYSVDTTDYAGVLRIAREEKIHGILGPASDVAVPTVARVAEALGLPGPPPEAANTVCDKLAFADFLAANRFARPETIPVGPQTRPPADFFAAGPGIVKPDRSSGAKGVFIVTSAGEYDRRLPQMLRFSPTGRGVLMRFIDGYQGTLIGVMRHGEPWLEYFLDRQTRRPPYAATLGLYLPARLEERERRAVSEQVRRLWALLALRDGAFVCDFIVGRDGVFILEITPRLGGSSVCYLIQQASGFDLITYCIGAACRDPLDAGTSAAPRPTGMVLLGTEEAGVLTYDEAEVERLRGETWVRRIRMDFPPGTRVEPLVNGRNRVGECLITADSRDQLSERELAVRARLGLALPSTWDQPDGGAADPAARRVAADEG